MKNELIEKMKKGRPVAFTEPEADLFREEMRRAMAVTLERTVEDIADGSRVFDELGLDSVDVFDLLDQLAETFEVQVDLEELPEEMIYGREGMTFRDFADGIIAYFRQPPEPAPSPPPNSPANPAP